MSIAYTSKQRTAPSLAGAIEWTGDRHLAWEMPPHIRMLRALTRLRREGRGACGAHRHDLEGTEGVHAARTDTTRERNKEGVLSEGEHTSKSTSGRPDAATDCALLPTPLTAADDV